MITLKEAYDKLPIEAYKNFEKFYYMSLQEDYLSPQWYAIKEIIDKILIENGINKEDLE